MKKILVMMFLGLLILGVTLNAPILLANHGDEHNKNSKITGSAVEDNEDNSKLSNTDSEIRIKNVESVFRERIKDRDGVIEREVEGRFFDAEGNEVRIKRKIKFKNGEYEIRTKLRIEGDGSNLSVLDSVGKKHRIRVTPERLRAFMLKRFNASNITDFSLEEIKHKNIPKVVYKFNSEHPGKFLGIFKIKVRAQTIIGAEDGEVIAIHVPWWAFLITGDIPNEDDDEVVGNEEVEDEIVADDDELEEELEIEEIDEEVDNDELEEEENETEDDSEEDEDEDNETNTTA